LDAEGQLPTSVKCHVAQSILIRDEIELELPLDDA